MVSEFCRFYPGYRAEHVLRMPAARFFAMWHYIPKIKADEGLELLLIQHGDPKEVRRSLVRSSGRTLRLDEEIVVPGVTPGTGAIDDERARQLREELRRKREEWRRRRQNRK